MKKLRQLVSVAIGTLVATTSAAQLAPVATAENRDLDVLHPRYFVRIYELKVNGDTNVVLTQTDFPSRRVHLRPYVEVDRRSTLHLDFDRTWMAAQPDLEADMLITAEVVGRDGSQPVEVPGYHVLGRAADSRPVRVQSAADVHTALMEFSDSSAIIGRTLRELRERRWAAAAGDSRFGRIQRFLEQNRAELAAANAEMARLRSDTAEARPEDNAGRRAEVADRISRLERAQADSSFQISRLQGMREYIVEASHLLSEHHTELLPAIARLTTQQSRDVLRIIARRNGRDPEVITAVARNIQEDVAAIRARPSLTDGAKQSELTDRLNILRGIENGLEELIRFASRASNSDQVDAVQLDLLRPLKEVDLPLSNAPIASGTELLLHIYNFRDSAAMSRPLDLRMRVRQFGWVRNVTDSYMFFYRAGLGSEYRAQVRTDSLEAAALARSTGTPGVFTAVTPSNFEPALGVSLGWTYYQRRSSKWYSSPLRWVEPGIGLNVSFPRFGSRRVTISRATPTDSMSPLTRAVEENRQQIGLSSGVVLSLFDGALQYTYGYSLSSDTKRRYHGVGFSFFEVAKRLAEAARN